MKSRIDIEKVAVLGAGTMGARIAAHLANAGVPCWLLDIVPSELTARRKIARPRAHRSPRPQPHRSRRPGSRPQIAPRRLFHARHRRAHHHRQFRGQPRLVRRSRLDHRSRRRKSRNQAQAPAIASPPHRRPGTIVTTNTSGLPIRADRRRGLRRISSSTGPARISSTRRAT